VTLVQIDLKRGRDSRFRPAAPAAGVLDAPALEPGRTTGSAAVLGVGLVLLVPLAAPAFHSDPAYALLLVGLGVLGLIAALLRPRHAEFDPP
jgi:hypothetical protein